MDCGAPPSNNPSVPSRCGSPLLLLTRALLMTSSHSEGLISSNWGGTPVQVWEANTGSLYNSMIAPFTVGPMALTGATWYQGESNVGQASYYAVGFPQMILGQCEIPLSNQESARGHWWIASPPLEGGTTQSISDLSMRWPSYFC